VVVAKSENSLGAECVPCLPQAARTKVTTLVSSLSTQIRRCCNSPPEFLAAWKISAPTARARTGGSPSYDPEVPAPRFKLTGPSRPEGTSGVSFV
jgi:hypothetical protein